MNLIVSIPSTTGSLETHSSRSRVSCEGLSGSYWKLCNIKLNGTPLYRPITTMATQHYVFLCDTASRQRQELLTKVQKRFKTPSSETLLFNASRVSDEATLPTALLTVSRLGTEVSVCAQSISTRLGVCICAFVCPQLISTRRVCACVCAVSQHPPWCVCVLCCIV